MHEARNRQLALLGVLVAGFFAPAAAGTAMTVAERLQVLEADEAAVTARGVGAGEWTSLRERYATLVREHPRESTVHLKFGEFLWRRDDRAAALREWQQAEKLGPNDARVLEHLAEAHFALAQPKTAAGYFERAVAVSPNNAHLRFALANLTFLFRHELAGGEKSAIPRAMELFAEAHRLAPNNVEYARAYAETFYAVPNADWAAARKVWEEYRRIAPDKDFAWLNLVRISLNLGDSAAAREALAQVKDAGHEKLKARLAARIEAAAGGKAEAAQSGKAHPNSAKAGIDAAKRLP